LLRLVDIVRPNASEAEALTGLKIKDAPSARRAARKLFALGIKALAVPIGERGDLILTRYSEQWLPRIKVKSIDATVDNFSVRVVNAKRRSRRSAARVARIRTKQRIAATR
jgi:hydroxymethylpyrimidine/phosphomethylpyrimidine kinase